MEVAQKDIKAELDAKEKAQSEAIAKVEDEMKAYQTKTAPAVKKANDERNARSKGGRCSQGVDKGLAVKLEAWEKSHKAGKSIWKNLDMSNYFHDSKTSLRSRKTVRFLGGKRKGNYVVNAPTELSKITGVRVEALSDTRCPRKVPDGHPMTEISFDRA